MEETSRNKFYYEIRENLLIIYKRKSISADILKVLVGKTLEGALIHRGYINLKDIDINFDNIKEKINEYLTEDYKNFPDSVPSEKPAEVYLLEQGSIPFLFEK